MMGIDLAIFFAVLHGELVTAESRKSGVKYVMIGSMKHVVVDGGGGGDGGGVFGV